VGVICLTGDLHHASLRTGNQRHADDSEIRIAARYLRMLEEAGVRVTFFVSGKAVEEEWEDLREIVQSPFVELGGHNYSCFDPALPHRVYKKLLGSYNGPPFVQRRDCRLTVDAIRRRTGRTIAAWRNHMYMHGPWTESVLAGCGMRLCSDGASATAAGPTWHPAGLWSFPLNVIPDHEHLYHAERSPEWVEWWLKRYGWSDAFGSRSYFVEEWTDIVVEQLRSHAARGSVANMIVHPITLYLCDRFRSFRRILDVLSGSETLHASDLVGRAEAARDAALRGASPQPGAPGPAAAAPDSEPAETAQRLEGGEGPARGLFSPRA
jgi:hypothetical protein